MVTCRSAGLSCQSRVDGVGIGLRQRGRVVAVGAAGGLDLRVAQVGEGDVVQLQVATAGVVQVADGRAVGRGHVGPEVGHVGVGLARDGGAAAAQVQHRRRRDRHLRRARGLRLQVGEVLGHDRPAAADAAGDRGNRRLFTLAGDLELRPRVVLACHAVQLRQEVQVPPVAAEFAVGDALQAQGFLLAHGLGDGLVLGRLQRRGIDLAALELRARGGERSGAQQAADLVGAERDAHGGAPGSGRGLWRPAIAIIGGTRGSKPARPRRLLQGQLPPRCKV